MATNEHDPVGDGHSILHNEDYQAPFRSRIIGQDSWLFTGGRRAHSLNGDWAFTLDLHFNGLRSRWFEMEPMAPEDRVFPYDWDPFNSDTTPVPSNWQMQDDKAYLFEGAGWYVRSFNSADLPEGARKILRIGAVAYECKVFLNGSYLGRHQGASTPFFVDLTDSLRDGENHLFLCVDNVRTLDRVPMRHTDWFNYGGVYREVDIYGAPSDVVRDLFVSLVPDGTFSKIRVEVACEGAAQEALFEVPGLGISQAIRLSDGKGVALLDAAPELWSPETPKLYDVSLAYGVDKVTDRIGFREISRVGTDILLNGKPIFLRGVAVHEDDETLGKVSSKADLERRFGHARELGCNFVRLAHYPHHEDAAKMADELGLLLWEELPVYWAIDFLNPATYADAENQLCELVRRDRNRASVIIWSVGNENPDSDPRFAFMSKLAEKAKELDPTRLTSAACLVDLHEMKINDRLASVIDVIGINEYFGWYFPNYDDLRTIGRNSSPDRPVVITETGADAVVQSMGGPEKGRFSEEYMADVYRNQVAILRELDYVKGISPWVLYDFRAERRQNAWQKGWNRKGLIAQDKATKKAAFGIMQAFYKEMAERGRE